jgi:hypothetical protein
MSDEDPYRPPKQPVEKSLVTPPPYPTWWYTLFLAVPPIIGFIGAILRYGEVLVGMAMIASPICAIACGIFTNKYVQSQGRPGCLAGCFAAIGTLFAHLCLLFIGCLLLAR